MDERQSKANDFFDPTEISSMRCKAYMPTFNQLSHMLEQLYRTTFERISMEELLQNELRGLYQRWSTKPITHRFKFARKNIIPDRKVLVEAASRFYSIGIMYDDISSQMQEFSQLAKDYKQENMIILSSLLNGHLLTEKGKIDYERITDKLNPIFLKTAEPIRSAMKSKKRNKSFAAQELALAIAGIITETKHCAVMQDFFKIR